jgi:hypothetical protein
LPGKVGSYKAFQWSSSQSIRRLETAVPSHRLECRDSDSTREVAGGRCIGATLFPRQGIPDKQVRSCRPCLSLYVFCWPLYVTALERSACSRSQRNARQRLRRPRSRPTLRTSPVDRPQSLVIACRSFRGKSARPPRWSCDLRDGVALAGAVVDGGRVHCRTLDGFARGRREARPPYTPQAIALLSW